VKENQREGKKWKGIGRRGREKKLGS